ncbi:carbohydrate ABC transporter permease [Clostridium sp. C105KSO13]|uniref:carbohydrate ABC transporter permease n=1 Tax=Clostridium sp. C105KSO13 TaxID=1776045 RepID=UPI0007405BD5|nr:carbohydrate ABC transporter permease [Clostridium sp. C105KSO13]CUX38650.1 Inner membrane ABC transporter permease protein YcjP [Clostridium sp. C105KSO13]
MNREQKRKVQKIILTFVILVTTVILILPFLWMISTSFKQADEIFAAIPKWLPREFSFQNYVKIWNREYFKIYFVNSLIVSLCTMGISLIVAMLAGYGISRFRFKGRTFFSSVLIVVQMFPSMLLLIPMYTIMSKMGLLDTHLSMIIAYTTFAMPFCTWMIKGYFDTIPVSLEESARIDGCGRLKILFRIIMPLAAPGIVTVSMFSFILSWQEYLYALTFARTEGMRTLTVGISLMQGQHGSVDWGQIMSGSVIACIPGLILFTYLEKYLVQGFTMGAVKE